MLSRCRGLRQCYTVYGKDRQVFVVGAICGEQWWNGHWCHSLRVIITRPTLISCKDNTGPGAWKWLICKCGMWWNVLCSRLSWRRRGMMPQNQCPHLCFISGPCFSWCWCFLSHFRSKTVTCSPQTRPLYDSAGRDLQTVKMRKIRVKMTGLGRLTGYRGGGQLGVQWN